MVQVWGSIPMDLRAAACIRMDMYRAKDKVGCCEPRNRLPLCHLSLLVNENEELVDWAVVGDESDDMNIWFCVHFVFIPFRDSVPWFSCSPIALLSCFFLEYWSTLRTIVFLKYLSLLWWLLIFLLLSSHTQDLDLLAPDGCWALNIKRYSQLAASCFPLLLLCIFVPPYTGHYICHLLSYFLGCWD